VKWDAAVQLDRKWHSLLAYESDSQLSFLLNATEDSLPTPSNLCRWNKPVNKMCPHGCGVVASLRHILCGCRRGEQPQWRVTWRHDSVLHAIYLAVLRVTNRFKDTQAKEKRDRKSKPAEVVSFKTASGAATFDAPRASTVEKVLDEARDWKVKFDIDEANQGKDDLFPAEILETSAHRPDGVVWSLSTKIVLWIELTCPWEENMSKWHLEKKKKYNQLKIDCEAKGWQVHPLEVEVGCRGYVSESFRRMCKVLGFLRSEREALKRAVEQTARHCSHLIFIHRYKKVWEERQPLDVSKWH